MNQIFIRGSPLYDQKNKSLSNKTVWSFSLVRIPTDVRTWASYLLPSLPAWKVSSSAFRMLVSVPSARPTHLQSVPQVISTLLLSSSSVSLLCLQLWGQWCCTLCAEGDSPSIKYFIWQNTGSIVINYPQSHCRTQDSYNLEKAQILEKEGFSKFPSSVWYMLYNLVSQSPSLSLISEVGLIMATFQDGCEDSMN